MPLYTAYGETIITLFDEDNEIIGEDSGHRPVYAIEAASLEAAQNAPLDQWEYTGDSNGTHGATFFGDYTYDDVCDQEVELVDVYNIEEDTWND